MISSLSWLRLLKCCMRTSWQSPCRHPVRRIGRVPRCEASAPVNTTVTTAKFTALQPKDTVGQFGNVWMHDYTVIVNMDGSFSGTGSVSDNGGSVAWTEQITGTFNADKTIVSFDTIPDGGGATFKVTTAPMNSTRARRVHLDGQRDRVPDLASGGHHCYHDDPRH